MGVPILILDDHSLPYHCDADDDAIFQDKTLICVIVYWIVETIYACVMGA